ncbi:pre-rRNA-processing protein pno1 [Thoreauomyces humboldtii]|nr:pre-rRNA-processing protein pno1 [Thoreauomyces humboldtii]
MARAKSSAGPAAATATTATVAGTTVAARKRRPRQERAAAAEGSTDMEGVSADSNAAPPKASVPKASSAPVAEGVEAGVAAMETDTTSAMEESAGVEKPKFDKLKPAELMSGKTEIRKVPVPTHRMSPLQKDWLKIYSPLVEHMKLQVRFNIKAKAVEMRSCKQTEDAGALQKGADFVKAYCLGFEIDDAIALLRLDDLFIDTFEVKDVKTLAGDNLSRAVGRIVGKDGKTKFAIENTSRTRIVIADTKIHVLGSFANIRVARDAVVSLILGSTPGKVYSQLRTISSRMKERF